MNCLTKTGLKIGLITLAGCSALFIMHGFAVSHTSNNQASPGLVAVNRTVDLQLDQNLTFSAQGANGQWHSSANFKDNLIPLSLGSSSTFQVKYQSHEYQCSLDSQYPNGLTTVTLPSNGNFENANLNGISCVLKK